MAINTTDPTLPNFVRPECAEALDDLTLMADLLGGTRRMHARSAHYIRKWADEAPAIYDIRRRIEQVYEGLGRTVSAATGMLFAKPPAIEWNRSEAAMTAHWQNVDAAGTAGPVYVKRFAEAALRDGLALLLVDHPAAPKDTLVTAANERALGLRPVWATYDRAHAINWRTAVVDNEQALTLLVLHEPAQVTVDDYGIATVDRYRVLLLLDGVATWELFEVRDGDGKKREHYVSIGAGVFRNRTGQPATRLPVAVAYTGRTDAPMTATVPLLGVAWANLGHWQAATDLRFYRSLCAFPQPTVKGALMPDPQTGQPGTLKVGPAVVVQVEAGGEFGWTELTGSSLEQLVAGVQEKERQMAQLGLSFLQQDKRVAETAEARRMDATAENSTLATAAQGIEDAVNLALEWHAWYLGIAKADAPVLTINRDFEQTAMDSATMTAYVGAVKDAGLPPRLLLDAWQRGGRIPADADLDAIEGEMMANAEAERARAEADAAARASAGQGLSQSAEAA